MDQTQQAPRKLEDLREEDLREWHHHPVSRLLVDHLQSARDSLVWAAATAVADDKQHSARLAAGDLMGVARLLGLLFPKPAPKAEEEEPFVDPAAITTPKKKEKKP